MQGPVSQSPHEDDSTLAERIRTGDGAALTTLFRRHYTNLVSYAASFLGDQDAAEETVCDVFAWVHLHRETWHPGAEVRAYLFRATRNQVLNSRRSQARELIRHTEVVQTREPAAQPDADLFQAETEHRIQKSLQQAIAQLSPTMREVIAMRWTHGLSYDEISTTLGITITAARMQVSRAVQKLRTILPRDISELME